MQRLTNLFGFVEPITIEANADPKDVSLGGDLTLITPELELELVQESALKILRLEAQQIRLDTQDTLDKGKGTEEAYPRHVKNYEKFWEADQERRKKADTLYQKIPAHPITGDKVTIFLKAELNRPKVRKFYISESVNYMDR